MTRIFRATLSNRFFQIAIIVLLAVFLQVLLVIPHFALPVNIPLCTLIALLCFEDLEHALFAAIIITALTACFSYNTHIPWAYPLIAFIGVRFRPEHISTKFYICILYTIIASLVFDWEQATQAIIANLATVSPIYFLLHAIRSANPKT